MTRNSMIVYKGIMKQLLVATTNPGKFKELKHWLSDIPVKILSLSDFPELLPVPETGKTLEENAKIKAKGYYARAKIPTVADDAGLEIDVLNGEPGVKTRRWIHPHTSAGLGAGGEREATDEELVAYALKRLQGVPDEKRTARLRTVVAFYDGTTMHTATAATEGRIVREAAKEIEPGYPFRSLLFLPAFGKLYKDLTPAEHATTNHRIVALKKLIPSIQKALAGTA